MEPSLLTEEQHSPCDGGARSVAGLLQWHAAEHPDLPFLLFEDAAQRLQRVSYGATWARALTIAALLRDRGVLPGTRVLVMLPNCPEFCELWFATALLEAVIVPVNPASSVDEIAWVLSDAGCTHAVGDSATAQPIQQAASMLRSGSCVLVASDELAFSRELPRLRGSTVGELQHLHVRSDALAAVLYTSGTTSRPKGVMVTHANYISAGDAVAGHLRLRPLCQDRVRQDQCLNR